MAWADSRSYCQSIGSDLATWGMRNASIRNWIIENLLRPRPDNGYWIGLSDIEQEGVWKYVDGVAITTTNTDFAVGEPSSGLPGEDCAHLWWERNYQMNDNLCSEYMLAICERIPN
uniref:C-type lectin domain family 4 member F-like n=1 Tax=Phallusia mammillata TaxID=59560 RepID=A0A6F9DAA5_9ASCI|nr:C-type lectin domain family 4 member F-like [Phallusia mammillata]